MFVDIIFTVPNELLLLKVGCDLIYLLKGKMLTDSNE